MPESADIGEIDIPSPKNSLEQTVGLDKDIKFEAAIAEKLREESKMYPENVERSKALLAKHGVDCDPATLPDPEDLEKFTDEDWQKIHDSETPLLTIHAAQTLHSLEFRTARTSLRTRRPLHPDPRLGHEGLVNRAYVESLPLIHGMTAEAFVQLMESGTMQSNKSRYKQSETDTMTFKESGVGATNLYDRSLGLDQFVYFDYGRPATNHRQQPEITLVVDQEVLNNPGAFMTERDVMDITESNSEGTTSMTRYMHGVTTPEYFHETAMLRIAETVTESGEIRDGGAHTGYTRYNSIHGFMQGVDGDVVDGEPTFSTYEVKIPDPPGVITDAIKKVLVRDQETFALLQQTLGDRVTLIHEPDLHAFGRIDEEADDPIDPGNYDRLQIPGAFEAKMEELIEADYQNRATQLAALADSEKEQAVIVFGTTEPDKIDANDIQTRINIKTNPWQVNDINTATYSSMDTLRQDVTNSRDLSNPTTSAYQPSWFYDWMYRQPGIQTPSQKCVLAIVERSKSDPNLCKILSLNGFSLDELQTAA